VRVSAVHINRAIKSRTLVTLDTTPATSNYNYLLLLLHKRPYLWRCFGCQNTPWNEVILLCFRSISPFDMGHLTGVRLTRRHLTWNRHNLWISSPNYNSNYILVNNWPRTTDRWEAETAVQAVRSIWRRRLLTGATPPSDLSTCVYLPVFDCGASMCPVNTAYMYLRWDDFYVWPATVEQWGGRHLSRWYSRNGFVHAMQVAICWRVQTAEPNQCARALDYILSGFNFITCKY